MVVAICLSACSLPSQEGRQSSQAITPQQSADTALGRSLAPLLTEHSGLSGVVLLSDPLGAFAARMRLISEAQRTIDIQYYIWRDDITGNLMLQALHEAAQRGVRVRLLVDDNGTSGLDDKLALLNAEPNAQVRLFNPFPFRMFKQLAFLTDFSRLNRRMHNKSLTVDGQVTIVGGRNIGDEYFGATQGVAFADLDVMVAGHVVEDVSHDFDRYWGSESAYPLERLVSMPSERESRLLRQEEAGMALSPEAGAYVAAVRQSAFIQKLLARELAFDWVSVRMVSDDPGKALGRAPQQATLMARLIDILGKPAHSVDLVSPYFVPTQQGVEAFSTLEKQGVRIRILTNSLEATDVTAVFAGYAKYRRPLLEQGITLFEMRREAGTESPKEKAGPFGSSGASLHAKTFAVDGKRVFVGSFNFDPRSALLNTELGFVIDSEAMARLMAKLFDDLIPNGAYQLGLDGRGEIVWRERTPQGTETLNSEPKASFWRLLLVKGLSWLPIESLL
ncbi:MAG: phospholipase D family protein [Castellaniella sp.]|uniref:phospholipase D family protein n=1 Tax=Castellaniella sp. TaxID=1955812 RepID=UPI003C732FA9